MSILITTTVSQVQDWTPDEKFAAIQRIVKANELRTDKLPFDTNINIKNSYQTLLGEEVLSTHLTNIDNIVADTNGLLSAGYADTDVQTVRKAMIQKAQSGKSPASIVAAILAL